MRILLCCEFYPPSVGGVQEVMKQIAERLVLRGHDVTVATTALPARQFDELNGVKVRGFRISGNAVRGMQGEVSAYRHYVVSQNADIVMIKAAQQWTFDALWPVLPKLKSGKVFIPCGFSAFYEPSYTEYFRALPSILEQFDHLVFYASNYRDINFVKSNRLERWSIIPNGASEEDFSASRDPSFRQRHGISQEDHLYLTVGSLIRTKGHMDVANAFLHADLGEHPSTLIVNGNELVPMEWKTSTEVLKGKLQEYLKVIRGIYQEEGFRFASRHVRHGLLKKMGIRLGRYRTQEAVSTESFKDRLLSISAEIRRQSRNKRMIITDLHRKDLVQAYMDASLFLFASHVEYSPLVLFESAAAGTPFLSVPVGNAAEIAEWTGGGVICPASQDERGYTKVDPKVLGEHWSCLVKDRAYLRELGSAGKRNWAARFTWEKIASQYENVFRKVIAYA